MRLLAAVLLVGILSGCSSFKTIDGNIVNYPQFESIEIDSAFKEIGTLNSPGQLGGQVRVTFFAKPESRQEGLQQFVAVSTSMPHHLARYTDIGQKKDKYYKVYVGDSSEIKKIFTNREISPYATYLCGEFYFSVYSNSAHSLSYCVSSSKILDITLARNEIAMAASRDIRIVHDGTTLKGPNTDQAAPPLLRREPATVHNVQNERGGFVALAYSKTSNKIYTARSKSSVDDAIGNIEQHCDERDCEKVYVTNEHGCVAFAQNSFGSWGKAQTLNTSEAMAAALAYCNRHAFEEGCQVTAHICANQ